MLKKSIVFSIFLLVAGLAAVQAQSGNVISAQGSSLSEKLAWLQAFAQSNSSYLLEVNANETIDSPTLEYGGKSNITVTLRGVGANRTIRFRDSSEPRIIISSSVTFVLDNNITLQGDRVNVAGTFTMNDGTISSNTAREYGGGVYVDNRGTFNKTSGTIYGYRSDPDNGNVVKNSSGAIQNYRGHAVYAGSTSGTLKIKETTAGLRDNLSYNGRTNPVTSSGAWDN